MKKRAGLILIAGLTLMFAASPGFADSITLTLIPASGNVSGPVGATVGWGYTITNNTPDWLETLSVSAGSFTNGTPNVIFDFPTVAPMSSVTLGFSPVATASCSSPPCGLYDLVWDNSAPVGTANSGNLTVSSEFFSGDPSNPASTDLGAAPDATASYSATVSPSTGVVPEPASLVLLLTGLCGLGLLNARRL